MAAMNRFYIVRLRKNDDIVAVGNKRYPYLKEWDYGKPRKKG